MEKKNRSHLPARDTEHSRVGSADRILKYNVPINKIDPEMLTINSKAIESSAARLQHPKQHLQIFFLNFTRLDLEEKFQDFVRRSYASQSLGMNVAICIFALTAMIEYAGRAGSGDGQNTFVARAALCGFVLLILGTITILMASKIYDSTQSQEFCTLLYTVCGCLLALSDVLGNSTLQMPTSAVTTVAFLIVYHLLGKAFLFINSLITTFTVIMLYIIVASVSRHSEEAELTVYHVLTVVFSGGFLCYFSHRFELRLRRAFLSQLKAEHNKLLLDHQKNQLMEDTNEIREDIYQKIIQKIELHGTEFRISSPAETIIRMLKKLQEKLRLPARAFQGVNKIISILGTQGNNIYKPQIRRDDQTASMRRSFGAGAPDVQTWIFDLVNANNTNSSHNNDTRAKEGKLKENKSAVSGGGGRQHAQHTQTSTRSVDAGSSSAVGPKPTSSTSAWGGGGGRGGGGGGGEDVVNSSSLSSPITSTAAVTHEVRMRNKLLAEIDDWNFDLFEVDTFTKGQPLLFITITLFQKYDFIRKYSIDPMKLRNFVSRIEAGYIHNPYHNSLHAADVVRSSHYFLRAAGLNGYMKPLEMLSLLVAAVIHDYEHPGVNNNFLIATKHKYAILYNDKSVLENHHLAEAFKVLSSKDCDIFENLKPEEYNALRKNVINLVLATDLASHFAELGKFSTSVASGKVDKEDADVRLMILRIALKCGDLGHVAKSFDQHKRWTGRITEEMYSQGDIEKKLGMKPSALMDRDSSKNIAKSQLGFIKVIVEPLFREFTTFLRKGDPDLQIPYMRQLKSNLAYWEAEAKNMKRSKQTVKKQKSQLQNSKQEAKIIPEKSGGIQMKADLKITK